MLDIDEIQREIEAGYIAEKSHDSAPYRILNYTQRAQFEWHWTDATKQCRGLIVDDLWKVVARPFRKFFSFEQLNGVVPAEPFMAFEKMDGSLGILYRIDGEPHIATRGSFDSEQALRATEIYRRKYRHVELDDSLTYLFEIIYPENRIVVDYEGMEDLILLATIETETGIERPLQDIGFPLVKRYDGISQFDELLSMQDDDREGFVVRFESGQRVKIKFEEYKRLHKLLTGFNTLSVWQALREGKRLDDLVNQVPDEFYNWIRETENDLCAAFARIELDAREEMRFTGTRKELAQHFKQCRYPKLMFSILDRKNYSDQIWRLVKQSIQREQKV